MFIKPCFILSGSGRRNCAARHIYRCGRQKEKKVSATAETK
ncbi:hypothetical protein EDWATA_03420 [Edwardsiella tarda ATCC 23685]|uniref:Uncharacterized protein n=1 Tax=Edwardsiella tarda ATCC 23685 TaxID=500638 RepID=D4F9G2_EDWTA|nr:hypothetical protein EDWATA_03420 [Edwardsiella tarda ATCC 23685]